MRMRTLAAGSALASVTLLSPLAIVPANAATVRQWDRVAQCESGQRWHLNTHNGYYGGLQFSGSTWRAYGGGRFARIASNATKSEQVTVANRVLRHQGWGAWPTCSRYR